MHPILTSIQPWFIQLTCVCCLLDMAHFNIMCRASPSATHMLPCHPAFPISSAAITSLFWKCRSLHAYLYCHTRSSLGGRDVVACLCSWAHTVPGIKWLLLYACRMWCHMAHNPLVTKHTSLPLNPQPEPALFINSRFHKRLIISVCFSRKLLGLVGAGKHVQITSPLPPSCPCWCLLLFVFFLETLDTSFPPLPLRDDDILKQRIQSGTTI